MDINNIKSTYGYIGFIPFAIFSIIPWIFGPSFAYISIKMQLFYGAIILAFLGGMAWGWRDDQPRQSLNLSVGIIFSLMAMLILVLTFLESTLIALLISIASFQFFYYFEKSSHDFQYRHNDYKKFRKMLSLLVSISFLLSFAYWINPYTNPI